MAKKFVNKWEVLITIIISITSVFLAFKANEMTRTQTEVIRNSSLPNIQVVEKNITNEETDEAYDSIIEISNLEGICSNYSSSIVTFLECSYLDEHNNFFTVKIPVFNYYIISSKSGKNIGILEEKRSIGNKKKIEKLLKKVHEYNIRREGSLYAEITSYLYVSYIDVLGEEQKIYYKTDIFNTVVIDEKAGEQQFSIYNTLNELNEGIDFNSNENVDVQKLINKIYIISDIQNEENIIEGKDMQMKGIIDGMSEIIGVFLAAFLAYVLWRIQEKKKDKENNSHAAAILYYDLKSIETYLKNEKNSVNIRYSFEWQKMLANCSFLKEEQVKEIYMIYDEIYNYNYLYDIEEKQGSVQKDSIPQYKELMGIFLNDSKDNEQYKEILEELKRHMI